MAILYELDQDAWRQWLDERPEDVRKLAEQLPPNRLYLMKTTNQRVTLVSYSEKGTVTVAITGEYNLIDFEREVFGVNPDNLVECDLPGPHEKLGVMIKDPQMLEAYIDLTRPLILAARAANPDDPFGKTKQ